MGHLRFLFFSVLYMWSVYTFSQENQRLSEIERKIDSLAVYQPKLNDSIDISVNGIELQEFVRAIAISNEINISIEPGIKTPIVNNFTSVRFRDILLFLVKEYDLNVEIIGNIILITRYEHPKPLQPLPKELIISYENNLLSFDLESDTLQAVAKKITQLTGQNIITDAKYRENVVSGFIQNLPVSQAVKQLCLSNKLEVYNTNEVLYLTGGESPNSKTTARSNKGKKVNENKYSDNNDYSLDIVIHSKNNIDINAVNAPTDSIIHQLSDELGVSYHVLTPMDGNESFFLKAVSYEDVLELLTLGTEYIFRNNNGIYLIGNRKVATLNYTRQIPLMYRTIEGLTDIFPKSLVENLEIKEFLELNSFIVSGSETNVIEFEHFINEIDKLVPVILIELIIIDYEKYNEKSTGIDMGIGEDISSSISILPELDITLASDQINKLLDNLNGFGWFNLGKVNENFYLSIEALEDNGIINVQSTPRLATLNGHEATLSNGETRYYYEEETSVISNSSVYENESRTYKSVDADLTITILPIVSGDDQITLKVEVTQSDFTDPEYDGAPPGAINRSFSSYLRVKDQEMVLLGGLEEESKSDIGSGIPILSRIPVIKWLFSSRTEQNSTSKLNIFLKSTVIN